MKKSPGLFIVLPVFIIAAAAVFWFAVRREAPSATGGTAGAPAGIPTAAAAQAAPDALAAGTGASAGTATASAAATPSASGATGGIDAAAATAGGTAVATPAAAQRLADTNPGFADALAQARKGDLFALVLPGGRRVSGTVNVATLRPDGTRYVGGKLDGWRRATFFFSLNAGRTPGGHVLVFDDERAFVIAAAAPAGAAAAPDAAASAVAAAPAAADLVWQEKHLGEVICHPYPAAPDDHHHSAATTAVSTSGAPGAPAAAAATAGTPAAASVTSAASSASSAAAPAAIPASAGSAAPRVARSDPVPAYESRPGASVVVLLDFDGAIVEDSEWNADNGGAPIVAAPSNLPDDKIRIVWRRVSEDYAPFNINITTDPAAYARAAVNRRIRCIITPTWQWHAYVGGVAFVGVMGDDSEMCPCWVFNDGYDGIAEAASHEIGHTFSLVHDGRSSPIKEYYEGHGTAPMRWGPIMGTAYGKDIAQWSKNEYDYGVNMAGLKDPTVISGTQDDIHLIASQISATIPGYANDGIGDTADTAAPIAISGTDFVPQTGIITSSDDVNYHRLVLPAPR
ncbi:MAG: zinc-dependent metalloprotease, partial [Opitutaceae bacterium]|nr:zinc-dependent metalloprotease [Opitutaceae bacterium]